jgi:uncharacterized protein YfaS (alpha-2-macroglobulin family)
MKYLFLLCLAIGLSLFGACKSKVSPAPQVNKVDQAQMEKLWKTIDSLENKGLIKSALDEVQNIRKTALAGQDPGNLFKSIMYENKYLIQLEEDSALKSIERGESELSQYPEPVRSVMYSLLADWYTHYLRGHLWELRSRTEYSGPAGTDIRTWGIRHFVDKIQHYYQQSVRWEGLKTADVKDYPLLLTEDQKTDDLRPTLYDILMHRSLDFFSGNESWLTRPAYDYILTDPKALASTEDFVKHTFSTSDSISSLWLALKGYQQLLSFRLADKDHVAALLEADLKRLQFVYSQMHNDQKDSLYQDALNVLSAKYAGNAESTLVDYYRAEWLVNKASQWTFTQDSAYRYAYNEALDICNAAISKFPDAYGTLQCKSLLQQIQSKSLNVAVETINLPNEELLAQIEYRNLDLIYLTVVKLEQAPRQWKGGYRNPEDELKKLMQLPVVKSWQQKLDDGKDHQPHTTEIPLASFTVGHYALIVSDEKEPGGKKGTAGTVMFTISSLGYWYLDDRENDQRAAIINRGSGQPNPGVKVEFITLEYNQSTRQQEEIKIGEAISDAQGWVIVPDVPNKNINLHLSKGGDDLFPETSYHTYGVGRIPQEKFSTLFFSDRAIYRPGQKVYFKGYAIQFNEEKIPSIVPNKKVDITLFDANGQEVSRQSLTSNGYGTFAGHFDLPTGVLTGQMSMSASHGMSRHYFRVEDYKRPKFEITFDTIRENLRLNEEVIVNAIARDYAGSAVSGGEVSYRIERVSRRPWWSWRSFWPGSDDRQVLGTGKGTTGSDGSIKIPFLAKTKPGSDPDLTYNFEVTVEITDITGETHASTKILHINKQGFEVRTDLGAKEPVENFKSIEIYAENSDGAGVKVNGRFEVSLLQSPRQHKRNRLWQPIDINSISDQEYTSRFPHYMLPGKEHMSTWPVEKVIGHKMIDINGSGKLDASSLMIDPGAYKLDWTWKDEKGIELKFTQYITTYRKGAPLPGYEVSKVFYNNKPYSPGDTVEFSLLTGLAVPPPVIRTIEHRTKQEIPSWIFTSGVSPKPVILREEDRGGVYVSHFTAYNNRFYEESSYIQVPWTNKDLDIVLKTWRDKMEPGDQETWTLAVSGKNQDKISAEMLLSMYDASLDAFVPHQWTMNIYPGITLRLISESSASRVGYYRTLSHYYNEINIEIPYRQYRDVNTYGYYPEGGYYPMVRGGVKRKGDAVDGIPAAQSMPSSGAETYEDAGVRESNDMMLEDGDAGKTSVANPPQLRSALEETVFFFPQLNTDEQGRLTFSFKMKEGLTRWKFQALGHTKELAFGLTEAEVVTQKKLMVFPNPPRFFREGDSIAFQAKITSLSDESLSGTASLKILDAISGEDVTEQWGIQQANQAFQLKEMGSSPVYWMLAVPAKWHRPVKYQVTGSAGTFSDGEEAMLPVVTNRILITETLPLPVKANETKTFVFRSMLENTTGTSASHLYAVEMTTTPAWLAVQALPYLMEYPHESSEQTFSRIYANALASHIAVKYPAIKNVYDEWRLTEDDALVSNLEKNQELKSALLEETPWVRDALGETQQKKNIALLFESNRLNNERKQALEKLQSMQMASGGFPWFPGARDSWYITQYILEGIGHLKSMGVNVDDQTLTLIVDRAVPYIDARMIEWYDELKLLEAEGKIKMADHHVSGLQVHYLYTRSFYPDQERTAKVNEIIQYLQSQFENYWLKHGLYDQGMIALSSYRTWPDASLAKEILASLRERTIVHDELGRYWKVNPGYHWNESAVEMQSLMVELFQTMHVPQAEVDELRVWLLKQKQTTRWKSTKATASAIYALLIHPDTWLQSVGIVEVKVGNKEVIGKSTATESGTGYVKKTWDGDEIKNNWSTIEVSNPNAHIAWGSVYWQYWEDIDKVKSEVMDNPLKISRALLRVNETDRGEVTSIAPSEVRVGDKLIVRLIIETDRVMEFVHLKDVRASGFEPVDVLSAYRWNGSLGYYQSTRNLATHFFIDHLPRGKHVIEYTVHVAQAGAYSEGLAMLQCMYAPEFGSHSKGSKVHAKRND